ncbi:hypothetical protein, partial [Acinetobacter baumannii]|uniref:hypothetical protein n=1 Tax=Acinetobacter baumannii TaxID=470 RepID=UPI001BC87FE7
TQALQVINYNLYDIRQYIFDISFSTILVTSLDTLIITFGHYGRLYFRHSILGIKFRYLDRH